MRLRGDGGAMSVAAALVQLGGVAVRSTLVSATSRREVRHAVAAGEIVAVARGRYAVPGADEARVAAHRLTGVLSHTSAALAHGWAVALTPELPHVTLSKHRVLAPGRAEGVALHRAELGPDDAADGVTTRERTLLDCLRGASDADALAVADSALRDGFPRARLLAIARDARGPGSARARRLAALADARSANGFESALRSIAVTVPGLSVRPQVSIRCCGSFLGRPDLVDEELEILLEADSFEWHGRREALARDTRRYNAFVVHGWLVLRFAWEDVMFDPEGVRATLVAVVAQRTQRTCEPAVSA